MNFIWKKLIVLILKEKENILTRKRYFFMNYILKNKEMNK